MTTTRHQVSMKLVEFSRTTYILLTISVEILMEILAVLGALMEMERIPPLTTVMLIYAEFLYAGKKLLSSGGS